MKATDQTLQETERALRKVTEKFPPAEEATMMTDIHLRVIQDTGELLAYDDDDNEINRCVVEQWIDNKDDHFYEEVAAILRQQIEKHKEQVEQMSILKPFSFVLEDDDRETVAELYLVDDDTVIINDELMANLDQDLDDFLEQLLKEYLLADASQRPLGAPTFLSDTEHITNLNLVICRQVIHLIEILKPDTVFL